MKLHFVTGSELVDFQGSSPTIMIHPCMQEGRQRWQEAHMHKQELLAKLRHKNGSMQEMEMQSGYPKSNMETLSESAGMPLGNPGPTWS